MPNKSDIEQPEKYTCKYCNFKCSKKSNYHKHLTTRKHQILQNPTQKNAEINSFDCACGKKYKHRSTLYAHKKNCNVKTTDDSNNVLLQAMTNLSDFKDVIMTLINENKDLKQNIFDITPNIQEINTTNNTSNSNNTNNFNISVFLNEHCKNAMNFSDFINNIQVSREDLQNNAQLGFVGGISKIITDNLKLLTVHERPIHCTDIKRETMYIRDDNSWKKDKDFVQEKLNQAIQEVSRKSVVSLMKWKQTNPDYADMDSDFSNLCLVIHQKSIAGYDRDKFYPKVIRRIAESVPCKGH